MLVRHKCLPQRIGAASQIATAWTLSFGIDGWQHGAVLICTYAQTFSYTIDKNISWHSYHLSIYRTVLATDMQILFYMHSTHNTNTHMHFTFEHKPMRTYAHLIG